MNLKDIFSANSQHSTCVGAGLVALDIVLKDKISNPLGIWAGGSCGNVLTILAYLGWKSFPIARIGDDTGSHLLIEDFERWGVNKNLLSFSEEDATPLVIQNLRTKADGSSRHSFDFYCPHCQRHLPSYKPVLLKTVPAILDAQPDADFFYFDRVQPSSIKLAKLYKDRGALIFFEPSGANDLRLFQECLDVADIVKISVDRVQRAHELIENANIPLTIITLGSEGLRYRLGREAWQSLEAYFIHKTKDSAGAGDWTSAGIIHSFSKLGITTVNLLGSSQVEECLKLSQAMGSLSCYYEGARGIMYNMSLQKFVELLDCLMSETNPLQLFAENPINNDLPTINLICPSCQGLLRDQSLVS